MPMFPNARIKQYYQQCEELLSFSGLSWWLIDLEADPNVFYCNHTMCETFHLDPKLVHHSVSHTCPIAGDYNKYIAIKSSDKAQHVFDDYLKLRDNTLSEYRNRFPYYDETQEKIFYFTSRAKALVRDEKGRATLLLGIIEPETASEELYNQASLDSLTGLRNRRVFDSELELLINLARREGRFVSLLLCDVDHFKSYNDTMGHYAGDECLTKIACALSESCSRETDTVCRYGGEEFAVITYGDDQYVSRLAENMRLGVLGLALPHLETELGKVTISIGYVSLIPDEKTTPRTLIENADRGLYHAKRNGRNQCSDWRFT